MTGIENDSLHANDPSHDEHTNKQERVTNYVVSFIFSQLVDERSEGDVRYTANYTTPRVFGVDRHTLVMRTDSFDMIVIRIPPCGSKDSAAMTSVVNENRIIVANAVVFYEVRFDVPYDGLASSSLVLEINDVGIMHLVGFSEECVDQIRIVHTPIQIVDVVALVLTTISERRSRATMYNVKPR